MRHFLRAAALLAPLTVAAACGEDAARAPVSPTPTCTFSVSMSATQFGAGGGTATATVGTSAACSWSAVAEADWVTIDGASQRTGEGTVPVVLRAFDGSNERAATVTIATQAFKLTQSGCVIRLNQAELTFAADGGARDVSVETDASCRWGVEGDQSWASLEPSSGVGAGVARVRANRNQSTTSRTAALQLGGQPLAVRQAGFDEPPAPPAPLPPPQAAQCSYGVTPVDAYVPSSGGTGRVSVSAPAGCTWTATSSLPHARVRSGASGSGPGVIEYEVDANPARSVSDFRKVAIEVRWPAPTAGQNVWLSQFGDCGAAGTVEDVAVPAAGGRVARDVLVESFFNCPWRVEGSADWLTILPPPGRINRGDGNVHLIAAPNTTGQSRSITLLVAERLFIVTQPKQ